MQARVLLTQAVEASAQDEIAQGCELIVHPPHNQSELLEMLHEVDAAILMLGNHLSAQDFEQLKGSRLKVIANHAVGYDNLDIQGATGAGIWVCNTPEVLTQATAEMAWALLLALARRVREGEKLVRSGQWQGWEPTQLLGQSVYGKKLGILGAGRIGQAMARMSKGFNMQIYYANRSAKTQFEQELQAQRLSIDALCREVDILSLHLPGGPTSRHLLNAERLKLLQSHCLLVNTGRGTSIDEKALIEALQAGQLAGAALDVYEYEPRVSEGLLALDNVVLAPHLGSATVQTRRAMALRCWHNIEAVLQGQKPPHAVNQVKG